MDQPWGTGTDRTFLQAKYVPYIASRISIIVGSQFRGAVSHDLVSPDDPRRYAQLRIAQEANIKKSKFEKLNRNLHDLVNELKGKEPIPTFRKSSMNHSGNAA